jgi:hypothetical protein
MLTLMGFNRAGQTGVGITAAESSGYSYMNESGVILKGDPLTIPVPGKKAKLQLNYNKSVPLAERRARYKPIKAYLGNVLNMFLDNTKDDEIRHLGISPNTQSMATALVYFNSEVTSREALMEHFDNVTEYLRSPVVRLYEKMRQKQLKVLENFSEEQLWKDMAKTRIDRKLVDRKDIDNLKELVDRTQELREIIWYLRSHSTLPSHVVELNQRFAIREKILANSYEYIDTSALANEESSPRLRSIYRSLKKVEELIFSESLYDSAAAQDIIQDIITDAKKKKRREPGITRLKDIERRLRTIAFQTGLHVMQDKANRMDIDKVTEYVAQNLEKWRKQYTNNFFLNVLELSRSGVVRIANAFQYSQMHPDDLTKAKAGWDSFFRSNPDDAIKLLMNSVNLYGLGEQTTNGGYQALVGPAMSIQLNQVMQMVYDAWRKNTFRDADKKHIRESLNVWPVVAMSFDPSKLDFEGFKRNKLTKFEIISPEAVKSGVYRWQIPDSGIAFSFWVGPNGKVTAVQQFRNGGLITNPDLKRFIGQDATVLRTWLKNQKGEETATFSAVRFDSFVTRKRINDMAYAMAYRLNGYSLPRTGLEISLGRAPAEALFSMITDPGLQGETKRKFFAFYRKRYETPRYSHQFENVAEYISETATAKRRIAKFTPDTGIDASEIIRYGKEMQDDLGTYSAIAAHHFDIQARVSLMPNTDLHNTLLRENRNMETDMMTSRFIAAKWQAKIEELAKKAGISPAMLDAFMGATIDGSRFIFNDTEVRKDAQGNTILNKDRDGLLHNLVWVDPETGRRASEIPELFGWTAKDTLYKNALSVNTVRNTLSTTGVLPEVDKIIAEYMTEIEARRKEANRQVKGFVDRLIDEDWIRKLPQYLEHIYKFMPEKLQPPDKTKSARLAAIEMRKTSLQGDDLRIAIEKKTDELYAKDLATFNKMIENLANRTGEKRREESGRSEGRAYTSYEEAGIQGGFVPESMQMTRRFTHWQSTVSEVIRNKKYITFGSTVLDVNNEMAMIPIKSSIDRERDKDTSVSTEQSYAVLDALLKFFNTFQKYQAEPLKLDPTLDPWVQIEKLVSENNEELRTRGFTPVEMPGFNISTMWVRDGAPAQLLEHITSKGLEDLRQSHRALYNVLSSVKAFNQFTKTLALGLSFFHHFALSESYAAAYGLTARNPLLTPFHLVSHIKRLRNLYKSLKEDPRLLNTWTNMGLVANIAPFDAAVGTFDKTIDRWIEGAGKVPILRQIGGGPLKAVRALKRWNDRFLWEGMQPAMKVQLAEDLLSRALANPDFAEVPATQLMQDIAQYVNDAFGGQEWTQYVWANPRNRDILQALMFAPDWTISALNIAGVPNVVESITGSQTWLSKRTYTNMHEQQMIEYYWPAFILITLVGVPAAVQAAIYMTMGNPDEGDKPFIWMNEQGRESYIDITPLWRALGQKYGVTNKRRAYLRWGKQGYEVLGWFEAPVHTLLAKSSMSVKVALEQVFNKNSAWWDMPWAEAEGFNLFTSDDGKWTKGRLWSLGEKFVPMSVSTLIQDKPASFFAPTRLGTSKFESVKNLVSVIEAYTEAEAHGDTPSAVTIRKNLDQLAAHIIDGAVLNGYTRDQVMSEAAGKVRNRLSIMVFAELNRSAGPREKELEELVRRYKRADGAVKNLMTSVRTHVKQGNVKFKPEMARSVMAAWFAEQRRLREEQKKE